MRTRGVRETRCRVCNGAFDIPRDDAARSLRARAAVWFSLKARDRLDAYTRAWWQSLANVFAAERRVAALSGARPTLKRALARSGSAKEMLAVLASAEAVVWAGRELKRGGESGRVPPASRGRIAAGRYESRNLIISVRRTF